MPDPKSAERIVLKVISGAQAGAEVSLEPGEYAIGTGADDDIQFIDVSMKPGHLRVRLAPGKIEIRNGAGAFHTVGGLRAAAADDEWQEIQPLDVITTGTTRFALGPPTAQWSTIADHGDIGAAGSSQRPTAPKTKTGGLFARAGSLAIPISLLILVLAVGSSFLIAVNRGVILSGGASSINDVATLRAALDRFSFGRALAVKQDVDGAVYVSGYVDSPVERRAIVGAIDGAGISVRLRLGVIQVLRSEIDGLIKAEKVDVRYDLSPTGTLTLTGVILSPSDAERFVAEVAENVIGIGQIRSNIETADSLFMKIKQLAHLSDIDDAVVFRLNGTVIEANGVISVNKIDEWVGFLQAYSRRFGDQIGLRSFVQLQSDSTVAATQVQTGPTMPILVGAVPPGQGIDLDINRLKSGNFKFSEAFAGPSPVSEARRADPKSPPSDPAQTASVAAPAPSGLVAGPIAAAHPDWIEPLSPAPAPLPAPAGSPAPAVPSAAPSRSLTGSADVSVPKKPPESQYVSEPPPFEIASVAPRSPVSPASNATTRPHGPPAIAPKTAREAFSPEATLPHPVALDADPPPALQTFAPSSAAGAMASLAPAKKTEAQTADGVESQAGAEDPDPPAPGPKPPPRSALPATFRHDVGDISDRAGGLISRWLEGRLSVEGGEAGEAIGGKDLALASALDTLADQSLGLAMPPRSLSEASKELFAHKYLPLFALSRESNVESAKQCRRGSRLSLDDLPAALFWLDLMSTTNAITLRDFDLDAQGFILEAALNPHLVAQCLGRNPVTAALLPNSIYLSEARRNPEFVRFVTQSLQPFALDVTGASLGDPRFVQLRDGSILREGEAPDAGSRIDSVGELGISILLAEGFATVIFGPDITWLAEER